MENMNGSYTAGNQFFIFWTYAEAQNSIELNILMSLEHAND